MRCSPTTSLQEYARGVAGGLLFSLPLLYTMEVWWTGFNAHPFRLLAYVLTTFLLLLGYNRYAGLRRDANFLEVAIDSIEEMGIGILVAALMLWLLGRITFDMETNEIVGKIVVEAMTVAIGVSVGTAQFGGSGQGDNNGAAADERGLSNEELGERQVGDDGEGAGKDRGVEGDAETKVNFGGQLVIACCGAVLFAANVAPTEEIVVIAVESSVWKLTGLMLFSIALGAMILYYIEFTGAKELALKSDFKSVLFGALVTYAVALASAALILLFFGRFEGVALAVGLAQVVVLGVAATLGASAGRLLVQ